MMSSRGIKTLKDMSNKTSISSALDDQSTELKVQKTFRYVLMRAARRMFLQTDQDFHESFSSDDLNNYERLTRKYDSLRKLSSKALNSDTYVVCDKVYKASKGASAQSLCGSLSGTVGSSPIITVASLIGSQSKNHTLHSSFLSNPTLNIANGMNKNPVYEELDHKTKSQPQIVPFCIVHHVSQIAIHKNSGRIDKEIQASVPQSLLTISNTNAPMSIMQPKKTTMPQVTGILQPVLYSNTSAQSKASALAPQVELHSTFMTPKTAEQLVTLTQPLQTTVFLSPTTAVKSTTSSQPPPSLTEPSVLRSSTMLQSSTSTLSPPQELVQTHIVCPKTTLRSLNTNLATTTRSLPSSRARTTESTPVGEFKSYQASTFVSRCKAINHLTNNLDRKQSLKSNNCSAFCKRFRTRNFSCSNVHLRCERHYQTRRAMVNEAKRAEETSRCKASSSVKGIKKGAKTDALNDAQRAKERARIDAENKRMKARLKQIKPSDYLRRDLLLQNYNMQTVVNGRIGSLGRV